jgi:hypothetical protein
VAASRSSPEPPVPDASTPGWLRAVAGLRPSERLAALGALGCAASTLLPWYRAPVDNLGKTAWGSFGFALAALLITVAAALALLLQSGRGRRPPTPLHEGTLLALAGIWSGVIIGYMALDRPTFALGDFHQEYDLAFGMFVALASAALLTVSGLRIRRIEALGERGRP